ncbi:LacI family DNA-binding transcriptional regulator [Boseaceae bacterium BT-24-1]|nr:LacI family DNA-binding transcriptional regulator [Boseaceae bacterium BT-24-1]
MTEELTKPRGIRHRRKMQRVTMMDVAKLARVSPSTVSLYLRKPDAVSQEAGKQIERSVRELGYVPNLVAGGLAAASSRVVSIIVPSIRNAFFAETVSTLQTELAADGFQVIQGNSEYGPDHEEALVRTALSWAPAAIILTGLSHTGQTRRMLAASSAPVVEMWELGAEPIDMAVGFSHAEVGITTARHLILKGRRKLCFVGARLQEDRRAAQRADGFMQHCRDTGVNKFEMLNYPGPASVEAGTILLNQIRQRMPDLDGLACSNDLVALGVLFECQRQGIAVPGQISVVGFGDLDFSGSCIPSLTTVRPFGDLIGREVARLIIDRITGDMSDALGHVVDTGHALIERSSS